ncbi:uncharacterized protein [Eurosta solidaginis]|uniref:uncharacterized protein isoform X2 n=1 Tax=Eurosta solidaginis TaxID=178769 RepID=UPI0035312F68
MKKDTRKRWTKEETSLFLQCYRARKEEFKHSRKKKYAYQNVLQDLMAQGFLDTTITTRTLEAKMRTLLLAYKSGLDNKKLKGASLKKIPFMEEMEDIFGTAPVVTSSRTLNSRDPKQKPLSDSCVSAVAGPSLLRNTLSSNGESSSNRVKTTQPSCHVSVFQAFANAIGKQLEGFREEEAYKLMADIQALLSQRKMTLMETTETTNDPLSYDITKSEYESSDSNNFVINEY